eukprot:CAMPEP_0170543492 /NCGR_PEP_ID=MMETSP0211-20121228/2590_1 /TAXON_ID=311385 /ORGANISM="Pseudokeronopsis sp., Strain OXSARD2" /LENGTH=245 /DNA_ID=CAMNT_0010846883 /DNA_START=97 /DNA_END=833 /DNA_ORIENTATION=+
MTSRIILTFFLCPLISKYFSELTYNYEGRDKLTKVFQYFSKFLSWYFILRDPQLSIKYSTISEKFRDARSLFRLFKSLFEIKRILIIFAYSQDAFSLVTNTSSRAFYLLYWIFDNLYICFKYFNIQLDSVDTDQFRKLARICWLFGLLTFLIYCIKTLRKTYIDESDLKVAAINKMTVRQVKENLAIICHLRRDYQINFMRAFSDLIICLNENNLPFLVLGKRINPGVEGVFGMLSGLIYFASQI